jgi:hypothetical protein
MKLLNNSHLFKFPAIPPISESDYNQEMTNLWRDRVKQQQ